MRERRKDAVAHRERSDDATLVEQIRNGGRAQQTWAFRCVIEKYQRPLYALVARITLRHEDADDVVQETFIRVFRNLSRYDTAQPLYPWMRRIALNVALSYYQRAKRRAAISLDHVQQGAPKSQTANPAEEIAHEELSEQLRIALEALPTDQRAVFQLRVQDELSYEEIAEALGIRIGTVMSRLNRARSKLRKLLQDYLEAEVSL
jgi:RNA polymerase sigma-70 factor (ECF subfamily)